MKPILSNQEREPEKCDPPSCPNCKNCRLVDIDGRPIDTKTGAPQLYAREAENYFFYYALNMKQGS